MSALSLREARLASPAPQVASRLEFLIGARLRADRAWLGASIAALLVLTTAPYIVAALFGPADLVRVGTFWFFRDFSQYLGAMRDAASNSSWLLLDRFTAEAHQPILMYVPYVALGKLAGLVGVDPLVLYYPVEALCRVALAMALYAFIATFVDGRRERLLAFLLSAFTLGFAAWSVPLRLSLGAVGRPDLVAMLPETVNVFLEMQSFGVFFSAPHLMLGLALTLALPPLYLRTIRGGAWWVLALAIGALGLVHPFNLPVVLSVLGADAALRLAGRREWRPLLVLFPAAALALPWVAYNALLFRQDPFWSGTYGVQNLMPSPWLPTVWVDFGIVLVAAPLGMWLLRPWRRNEHRLLLLWVVLTFAWMYFPVAFQRRLGFGLQPALAVLAALALVWLQPRVRLWKLGARPFNYAVALLTLATSVLVFVSLLASAATNKPSQVYSWTTNEQAAAEWIASTSGREAVVLSSIESGNSLVGVISGRVVVGHIVATLHAKEKEALAKRFFSSGIAEAERAWLLADSRATYVFVGPQERKLGSADLTRLTALERVYSKGGVDVYRVRGPVGEIASASYWAPW